MPEISRSKSARSDADCKPCTDALFEDICALTGVPFPNLLYRVLAEHPKTLEDCWSRVRGGIVTVGPGRLRDRFQFVEPVNTVRFDTLSAFSGTQRRDLLAVLDVYDSGNSCNGVVAALLLRGSEGKTGLSEVPEAGCPAGLSAPSIPPMIDVDALPEPARTQVFRLARIGDPQGQVVPSLFRHLPEDEKLLRTVADRLEIAVAGGEFERAHRQVEDLINNAVDQWPEQVDPVCDPSTRDLIKPFARTIPRMIAVSVILRRGLQGPFLSAPL